MDKTFKYNKNLEDFCIEGKHEKGQKEGLNFNNRYEDFKKIQKYYAFSNNVFIDIDETNNYLIPPLSGEVFELMIQIYNNDNIKTQKPGENKKTVTNITEVVAENIKLLETVHPQIKSIIIESDGFENYKKILNSWDVTTRISQFFECFVQYIDILPEDVLLNITREFEIQIDSIIENAETYQYIQERYFPKGNIKTLNLDMETQAVSIVNPSEKFPIKSVLKNVLESIYAVESYIQDNENLYTVTDNGEEKTIDIDEYRKLCLEKLIPIDSKDKSKIENKSIPIFKLQKNNLTYIEALTDIYSFFDFVKYQKEHFPWLSNIFSEVVTKSLEKEYPDETSYILDCSSLFQMS